MMSDTPLTFSRRACTPGLPEDGAMATAAVLAYVRGDAQFLPAAAVDSLRARVEALRDPLAPDSLQELARQLPVLEALWLHYAVAAVDANGSDQKAKLLRMALQAQQAYARTFTLVRGLALRQQGQASVTMAGGDD